MFERVPAGEVLLCNGFFALGSLAPEGLQVFVVLRDLSDCLNWA